MKALCLTLATLLFPLALFAAPKKVPNPADFPVLVHVLYSRVGWLYAVVDRQPIELALYAHNPVNGILNPADYKARLLPNLLGPKNPNGFDLNMGYELLLPDGSTRKFLVSGIGVPGGTFPAAAANP